MDNNENNSVTISKDSNVFQNSNILGERAVELSKPNTSIQIEEGKDTYIPANNGDSVGPIRVPSGNWFIINKRDDKYYILPYTRYDRKLAKYIKSKIVITNIRYGNPLTKGRFVTYNTSDNTGYFVDGDFAIINGAPARVWWYCNSRSIYCRCRR